MYKLIGLFALVAAVAGNDLTVGSGLEGTKIYDEKLEASPAIWRQDKNYTVNATEGHVISRVVITDLREEKNGEAQVVEGGEGHKNVTVELKSPAVFRGFEFIVQVYEVPDKTQQGVSTDFPKSEDLPKVPENEPKVPISVGEDNLDDSLRKTRKTAEQDNVTPKLFVIGEAATTPSAGPADHSSPVSNNPTTVPSNPSPVPSIQTPVVIKNAEKFNIPIDISKDANTEVSTTKSSDVTTEKNGESDVIDPALVSYQPTHLNNTEKSTENAKASDKTTVEPAIQLPEVFHEGSGKEPQRKIRHTDLGTTESDVTTNPSTTLQESTTEMKDYTSSEEDVDSSETPVIPNYSLGVVSLSVDTIKPIGINKDLTPPKTIGADNAAVQSKPTIMVPLPYNH